MWPGVAGEVAGDDVDQERRPAAVQTAGIYGEATPEDARSLAEDGVVFMPIPVIPDDHN